MNFFQYLSILILFFSIAVSAIETDSSTSDSVTVTTTATAPTAVIDPLFSTPISTNKNLGAFDFEIAFQVPCISHHISNFIEFSNSKLLIVRYTFNKILVLTGRGFRSAMQDAFTAPVRHLPPLLQELIPSQLPDNISPVVHIYMPLTSSKSSATENDPLGAETFYQIDTSSKLKLLLAFIIFQLSFKVSSLISSLIMPWRKNSMDTLVATDVQNKTDNASAITTKSSDTETHLALSINNCSLSESGVGATNSNETPSPVNTVSTDNESDTARMQEPSDSENTDVESSLRTIQSSKLYTKKDRVGYYIVIPESINPVALAQNETVSAENVTDRDSDILKRSANQNELCQNLEDTLATDQKVFVETPLPPPLDYPWELPGTIEADTNSVGLEPPTNLLNHTLQDALYTSENEIIGNMAMEKAQHLIEATSSKISSLLDASQTPLTDLQQAEVTGFSWTDMEPFDKNIAQCCVPNRNELEFAHTALNELIVNLSIVNEEDFTFNFNSLDSPVPLFVKPKPGADIISMGHYINDTYKHVRALDDVFGFCEYLFKGMRNGIAAVEDIEKRFVKPELWNKLNLSRRMDNFFTCLKRKQDFDYDELISSTEEFRQVLFGTPEYWTRLARFRPYLDDTISTIDKYLEHQGIYRLMLYYEAIGIVEAYNKLCRGTEDRIDRSKLHQYELKVCAYRKQKHLCS